MIQFDYAMAELLARVEAAERSIRALESNVSYLWARGDEAMRLIDTVADNLVETVNELDDKYSAESCVTRTTLGLLLAEVSRPPEQPDVETLCNVLQGVVEGEASTLGADQIDIFRAVSSMADDIVTEARDWQANGLKRAA